MLTALLNSAAANLVTLAAPVLGQVEGDGSWLLLLGPVGAGATYYMVYRYYRNTDKSHTFEHETLITAQPVTGDDVKVREIRGTRQAHIQGDNRTSHRQRVQRE